MGITLPVFKIAVNIPIKKDKLHIVARCLNIRCKILLGMLLVPQDLLFIER